jgi:hypothetical protein
MKSLKDSIIRDSKRFENFIIENYVFDNPREI